MPSSFDGLGTLVVEDAIWKGKIAGSIPGSGKGLLPVRHCDFDSGSDEILQLFFFANSSEV